MRTRLFTIPLVGLLLSLSSGCTQRSANRIDIYNEAISSVLPAHFPGNGITLPVEVLRVRSHKACKNCLDDYSHMMITLRLLQGRLPGKPDMKEISLESRYYLSDLATGKRLTLRLLPDGRFYDFAEYPQLGAHHRGMDPGEKETIDFAAVKNNAPAPAGPPPTARAPAPKPQAGAFPAVTFPALQGADAKYLGVPAGKAFTLKDIAGDFLIIDLYSLKCYVCQQEAYRYNDLFDELKKDPQGQRVRFLGLARNDSAYEAKLFHKKFAVPFPAFPDPELTLSDAFDVEGTPMTLILDLRTGREVYRGRGRNGIKELPQALKTLLKDK